MLDSEVAIGFLSDGVIGMYEIPHLLHGYWDSNSGCHYSTENSLNQCFITIPAPKFNLLKIFYLIIIGECLFVQVVYIEGALKSLLS